MMSIDDTLKNLTDNVTDTILKDVKAKASEHVSAVIKDHIQSMDLDSIVNESIKTHVNTWLDSHEDWLTKTVNPIIDLVRRDASAAVLEKASDDIKEAIGKQVSKFDELATKGFADQFHARLRDFNFPPESIPATALKFDPETISGDNISGGIQRNFNSVGIQDLANDVQMTVSNDATTFENKLVASELEVVGKTTLKFVEMEGIASQIGNSAHVRRSQQLPAFLLKTEHQCPILHHPTSRSVNPNSQQSCGCCEKRRP